MPRSTAGAENDPAFFAEFGIAAVANGYHAFPIPARTKTAVWEGWPGFCRTKPREDKAHRWLAKYGRWSVGIACGWSVIAIDIDELDAARAEALCAMTELFLGRTPFRRFGRVPRRVLVYRVDGTELIPSRDLGAVQLLADGKQFVAFGKHPDTHHPYHWIGPSPATLALSDLPCVTAGQVGRLVNAFALLARKDAPMPETPSATLTGDMGRRRITPFGRDPWPRQNGQVVDGRDSFLACLVWDAARSGLSEAEAIAQAAWTAFVAGADLSRPKRGTPQLWSLADAREKARALVANGKARTRIANGKGAAVKDLQRKADLVRARGNEDRFWTEATKHAFALRVMRASAERRLSPSALKVSELMLGLVYGVGACFASAQTLAEAADCSLSSIKRARHDLREAGFWTSYLDEGGKGYVACFFPNPDMLAGPAVEEEAPEAAPQTVATSDTTIFQRGVAQGGQAEPDFSDLVADTPRPTVRHPLFKP